MQIIIQGLIIASETRRIFVKLDTVFLVKFEIGRRNTVIYPVKME